MARPFDERRNWYTDGQHNFDTAGEAEHIEKQQDAINDALDAHEARFTREGVGSPHDAESCLDDEEYDDEETDDADFGCTCKGMGGRACCPFHGEPT